MKPQRFNPLLHGNFKAIPEPRQEIHTPIQGSGTIPRTFLRMSNLCSKNKVLEKSETMKAINVQEYQQVVNVERGAAENAKMLKEIFRCRKIHGWKKYRKTLLGTQQTQMLDEGLSVIASEASQEVQQLGLFFKSCNKITNNGVGNFVTEVTRNRPNLQVLMFCFAQPPQLSDECMKIVGKELSRNIPNVNNLYLKFPGCKNITDKGFIPLGFGISGLTNLQKFSGYFDSIDGITSKGFSKFGYLISSKWHDLRQLRLSFGGCNGFNDEGVEQFHSHIGKHLTKLELLTWNLSNCDELTDGALEGIGKSLVGNLNSLRYFVISFDNCTKITDKGGEILATYIANNLPRLKKLVLSFYNCNVNEGFTQKLYGILESVPVARVITKNIF